MVQPPQMPTLHTMTSIVSSRPRRRERFVSLALAALLIALCGPVESGHAATGLPPGFQDVPVVSGLSNPTAMEFSPDGRLFVTQQGGQLRVIKNGVLLSTPFLTLTVDSAGERGLLGIAFDPNFASNQFVYVYLHGHDARHSQSNQPLQGQWGCRRREREPKWSCSISTT